MAKYAIKNIIEEKFKVGTGQVYEGSTDIHTGNPITKGVYLANLVDEAHVYCSNIEIPVN